MSHPDAGGAILRGSVLRAALAEEAVALLYARKPELATRYGALGQAKCVEDTRQTLLFLSEALNHDSYPLFADYVAWLKTLFTGLSIDLADLTESFACLAELTCTRLPAPDGARAAAMLRKASAALDTLPVADAGLIVGDDPTAELARAYLDAQLNGDKRSAARMILSHVEAGMPVQEVYLRVFQPVLREVGRLWQTNRISVAHEHFVTAATQAVMAQLYRHIFTGTPRSRAMIATCVSGELHEIGLRMVADCFEMAGWDSHYLGANTPPRDVVATVREREAAILAISATLTSHLGMVADLIALARQAPDPTIILVGGYPFNVDHDLWRRIGADGMAVDAGDAVAAATAIEAAR